MADMTACDRAQTLAGAIALGEAREEQRDAYRLHVAGCARCLEDFGGEREIERTMRAVATARESESWEPDVRALLARRGARLRSGRWAALAGAALLAAFGFWAAHGRAPLPARLDATAQRPAPAAEARDVAALGTQAGPRLENRADLLALGADVRAARTAGTASFAVRLDAAGRPAACTITKSSGERSLDEAICLAAMHAR